MTPKWTALRITNRNRLIVKMALNFGVKSFFEYLRGPPIEFLCRDENSSIGKVKVFFQKDKDNYNAPVFVENVVKQLQQ